MKSSKSNRVHTGGSNQEKSTTSKSLNTCFSSIKDLPFRVFQEVMVEGNLSVLIIEGEVTVEELATAWQNIQDEYSEAIGGVEGMVELVYDVEALNSKIQRIENALIAFLISPTEDLLQVFRAEGMNYPIDDLKEFVSTVRNRLGDLEFKLQEAQDKIDRGEVEHPEPTYEMYEDLFAEIRKMEGWAVPDSITTLQFCTYYKRLVKYYERLNREHGKRTTGQFTD